MNKIQQIEEVVDLNYYKIYLEWQQAVKSGYKGCMSRYIKQICKKKM